MPKMRKKSDLPAKACVACGRPFVWRKKWERVWAEVKYCSDACRTRGKARPLAVRSQGSVQGGTAAQTGPA
ncbi:MAG: DUF2256 domain-containing protein [Opitutaceae bacterium]|nr:DUF2256 domain-containing protein [Opitutaceae bacterium]